jgi:hypothetical protein
MYCDDRSCAIPTGSSCLRRPDKHGTNALWGIGDNFVIIFSWELCFRRVMCQSIDLPS